MLFIQYLSQTLQDKLKQLFTGSRKKHGEYTFRSRRNERHWRPKITKINYCVYATKVRLKKIKGILKGTFFFKLFVDYCYVKKAI